MKNAISIILALFVISGCNSVPISNNHDCFSVGEQDNSKQSLYDDVLQDATQLTEQNRISLNISPRHVAIDSTNSLLGIARGSHVYQIDLLSGQIESLYVGDDDFVADIVFDNANRLNILIGESNRYSDLQVELIDFASEEVMLTLDTSSYWVNTYPLFSTACLLVDDKSVDLKVIDTDAGSVVDNIRVQGSISALDIIGADGTGFLAYATFGDNDSAGDINIVVLDLQREEEIWIVERTATVEKLEFLSVDQLRSHHHYGAAVRIWDTSQTSTSYIDVATPIENATDIEYISEQFALLSDSDDKMYIWDYVHNSQVLEIPTSDAIWVTTIADATLVTVSSVGEIIYWEIQSE